MKADLYDPYAEPFSQLAQENAAFAAHPLYGKMEANLRGRLDDLKETQPVHLAILSPSESLDPESALEKHYDLTPQDGLFLGVAAGGQTLHELRDCLTEAEISLSGGAHARFLPMMGFESLSHALLCAGFSHAALDKTLYKLVYDNLYALIHALRRAGLSALVDPPSHTPRELFERASKLYHTRFPAPQGGIAASFELFTFHGWRE